jgi:signal transduction histidine kinase
MMAVLILTGSYFIARAFSREMAVARLQTDFVAAVSHEFRTPLTTMRQLTEMLARGRIPSEERRQRYYDVLAHETGRLHRLVEGLLNFGRMEAGAQEFRFEKIDAMILVRGVVTDFQREAESTGYRIELQTHGISTAIKADKEALERALWNLLDNAVKYSPDSKTIWVEVARYGIELVLRVRDRGVGMAAKEQKEIFRKFVRGEAAKSASIKGTGIGLSMVHRIVEAHGGRIRVESEPGRGSTFTIVLPLEG